MGFNHPLTKLPSGLTHLKLKAGRYFNHSIDQLPDSIKYLSLGFDFKHFPDKLPKKLVCLRYPNYNYYDSDDDNSEDSDSDGYRQSYTFPKYTEIYL